MIFKKAIVVGISLYVMSCAHVQEGADVLSPADVGNKQQSKDLIVIAHRGASGYLPEHTIEAYQKAIDQGADFIEPDLVATKDHVLISRHENEISETTNVQIIFPERKTTKVIDGKKVSGWFVEDFTLAEIKKLKARQRLPIRPQSENDKFQIPSFEEIIQLVKTNEQLKNKKIGIIPELKHSTYFQSINLALEEPLIEILKKYGLNEANSLITIQSFEVANLKKLKKLTPVKRIQLIGEKDEAPYGEETTYKAMMTAEGLKKIATYANGIGPSKRWLIKEEKNQFQPSDEFKNAKLSDLEIYPYTFRNESYFLLPGFKSATEEYEFFMRMGVTGVFSDFPDTALKAKNNIKKD